VLDRDLVHAWAGLGVYGFDVDAVARHLLEHVFDQVRVLALAHPGVAEHAWAERLEVRELLGAHALRRLAEDPELELGR